MLGVVNLPGATITRATFQPGWKWRTDVAPIVGTRSCQVAHTGYSSRDVVRGDTAVTRTHTDGKNTVRATGDAVPGRYRELFVLHRHATGWKIAHQMFQPRPAQEQ